METEKKSSNGLLLLFGLIIGFSLTLACTYCLVLRAIKKKNPLIEIDSKFVRQELMIEELRDTANNRYLKYKTKHLEDSVRISALFNQIAIWLQRFAQFHKVYLLNTLITFHFVIKLA